MRILQGAAFMALLIGAAGVTGPDGAIQPAAVVIIAVSLIVLSLHSTMFSINPRIKHCLRL